MHLKRTFLLGMVGSLTLAAMLGIWAFLFGAYGYVQERLILTTLSVALFSLTCLGAAAVYERGRWRPLMCAAFALNAVGLVVYLLVIWVEFFQGYWIDEAVAKFMFLVAVWAIALPHAGLLAVPRFAGALPWAQRAAVMAVFSLAGLVTFATLTELAGDEDLWFRVIGVLGILAALGTISVPILARVQGIDKLANVESTPMEVQLTCPRCLTQQTLPTGPSRCRSCRLKFEISIEEPRCPGCNYLLHKLTEPVCPECGRKLGRDEIADPAPALDA